MTSIELDNVNDERAARAELALAAYDNGDDADDLTDLLTDLMHLCARDPDRFFPFAVQLERAVMHFEHERQE